MRRLWAYIIVVFTVLIAVFASFPTIMKGASTNGEYEARREFTFQLVKREQSDDDVNPKELTSHSARDVAEIMESRLVKAKITSYDIYTTGNDMITVAFSADSDEAYAQTITYLAFSGSFALVNNNNDIVAGKDFIRGKAYTKKYEVNEFPTVLIPVKTDTTEYKEVVEKAKSNPVAKTESTGEEDEDTEKVARLWLLYNWNEGETYDSLVATNKLDSKTLLKIDFTPDDDEEGLYYDSNKNSFSQVCGYRDNNQNGIADPDEVKAAYAQADYLVNLFSASKYDYEVKCVRGLTDETITYIEAKTEDFLDDNGRLIWNRTLTAVVAGIVIVTLLLVFFYKLGTVSVLATSLSSAFLSILVMVKTGLEYNALAVVGIVTVAILTIVSCVIYMHKFKEDTYKGHTIKKANAEASKKSLLPIVDIHIVSIVIGVMCYLLGGDAMRSFSAILGIGSLISLIISTLGLKGLMWLVTNATALNGRYDLFGIEKEKVPDHMAEEKQTYFGAYVGRDFTKHQKKYSIAALSLFLLSVAGIIALGTVRHGELFKKATPKHLGSEIYIQNRIIDANGKTSPLNDDMLQTITDSILIQKNPKVAIDQEEVVPEGEKPKTYYVLSDIVTSNLLFTVSETVSKEDEESKTYLDTYFKLELSEVLSGKVIAEIKGYPSGETTTLEDVLEDYFQTTSLIEVTTELPSSIKLKQVETVVAETNPKWEKIILATSVSIAIATVYLMFRYRLSRGLASIVIPVLSATFTLAIMLILNFGVAIPANTFVAIPVIVLFSYFFMISFFNKERELIAEDKVKDNTVEHRAELANRALGVAFTPILAMAVIGIYILINFFGFGPTGMSTSYVAAFVGAAIALGIITTLMVPLCNFLYKLFSKIAFERKPRKNKNVNKPVKKSAEPEEAIFIGIND